MGGGGERRRRVCGAPPARVGCAYRPSARAVVPRSAKDIERIAWRTRARRHRKPPCQQDKGDAVAVAASAAASQGHAPRAPACHAREVRPEAQREPCQRRGQPDDGDRDGPAAWVLQWPGVGRSGTLGIVTPRGGAGDAIMIEATSRERRR